MSLLPTAATLGFEFTPTVNIAVTQLGVFDVDGDGLAESHDVGIWRASDMALLASDTIAVGTGALLDPSGFRFTSLASSVQLSAGTVYRIGALYTTALDELRGTTITVDSRIQITDVNNGVAGTPTVFHEGGVLSFPEAAGGFQRTNVNFAFTAVPEPSSVALLLIGAVLVVGVHRRKMSRAAE
ncbi:MAG: DUF4082 domain-containing protein [Planctomycetaceae bacterium]